MSGRNRQSYFFKKSPHSKTTTPSLTSYSVYTSPTQLRTKTSLCHSLGEVGLLVYDLSEHGCRWHPHPRVPWKACWWVSLPIMLNTPVPIYRQENLTEIGFTTGDSNHDGFGKTAKPETDKPPSPIMERRSAKKGGGWRRSSGAHLLLLELRGNKLPFLHDSARWFSSSRRVRRMVPRSSVTVNRRGAQGPQTSSPPDHRTYCNHCNFSTDILREPSDHSNETPSLPLLHFLARLRQTHPWVEW